MQIGRMVDELESMGMMDNTLLVIASDNGGCPSGGGSNYPYRGMKHTLFEGGVRVPAMVYSTSESLIPAAVSLRGLNARTTPAVHACYIFPLSLAGILGRFGP